ncbi:MAG TPA: hypothetical protein VJJ47_03280 [Candidatus Paceibacterota bacterium]
MKFIINKKFIGSTIILVVGVFMVVGSLTNPNSTTILDDSSPGLFIILGALAYRSAKQRKLKLVENTKWRKLLEFLATVLIVALILLGPNIPQLIQDGDITNLVIFAWAMVAYLFAIPKGVAEQKKV